MWVSMSAPIPFIFVIVVNPIFFAVVAVCCPTQIIGFCNRSRVFLSGNNALALVARIWVNVSGGGRVKVMGVRVSIGSTIGVNPKDNNSSA